MVVKLPSASICEYCEPFETTPCLQCSTVLLCLCDSTWQRYSCLLYMCHIHQLISNKATKGRLWVIMIPVMPEESPYTGWTVNKCVNSIFPSSDCYQWVISVVNGLGRQYNLATCCHFMLCCTDLQYLGQPVICLALWPT